MNPSLNLQNIIFAQAITMILSLTACSESQPTPTVSPTATPATALERVEIYDKHIRWFMSLLLQAVTEIELNKQYKPAAFSAGIDVFTNYLGVEHLDLPSKADFAETANETGFPPNYDPAEMHQLLLGVLIPCKLLGLKALGSVDILT